MTLEALGHRILGLREQGVLIMLVLSRKVGERIQLGDNITVTLVKVSGSLVRLGIEAPASMPVVREELLARGIKQVKPANADLSPARA
jgi:carbon storage regulator